MDHFFAIPAREDHLRFNCNSCFILVLIASPVSFLCVHFSLWSEVMNRHYSYRIIPLRRKHWVESIHWISLLKMVLHLASILLNCSSS